MNKNLILLVISLIILFPAISEARAIICTEFDECKGLGGPCGTTYCYCCSGLTCGTRGSETVGYCCQDWNHGAGGDCYCDEDCVSNYICRDDGAGNALCCRSGSGGAPRVSVGSTCYCDIDCTSNNCSGSGGISGTCQESNGGGYCTTASDCLTGGGFVCVSNTCCYPSTSRTGGQSCYCSTDCASGFSCSAGTCTACSAEVCNNGVDDDCDGQADCADADCTGDPACSGGPGPCVPTAEVCNNGVDDDCDGRADCNDNDCSGYAGCGGSNGSDNGFSLFIPNPVSASSTNAIVQNVIYFIFTASIFIAPLMIIIAAFMLATAAGDTNKVNTAKKIILWTVIGFGIVLLSRGIFEAIKSLLV